MFLNLCWKNSPTKKSDKCNHSHQITTMRSLFSICRCRHYKNLIHLLDMFTLCSWIRSHAELSEDGGKFSRINFPAFHSLLVKPLLEVNLSIERLTSWRIIFTISASRDKTDFLQSRETRQYTMKLMQRESNVHIVPLVCVVNNKVHWLLSKNATTAFSKNLQRRDW